MSDYEQLLLHLATSMTDAFKKIRVQCYNYINTTTVALDATDSKENHTVNISVEYKEELLSALLSFWSDHHSDSMRRLCSKLDVILKSQEINLFTLSCQSYFPNKRRIFINRERNILPQRDCMICVL